MKWFKHYGNAHSNQFLQALLREKDGLALYAQWFLLLEFLCMDFKKDSIEFHASNAQLKAVLQVGQDRKLLKVLETFSKLSAKFDRSLLEVSETSDKVFKIKTPIILELMGKEFKRTRSRGGQSTAKKENKNKNKNKIYTSENLTERVDYEFYSNCWNILTKDKLPQVKNLSPSRKKAIKILIGHYPSLREDFEETVKKVIESDFLCGRTNSGNFTAGFDWILKSANYTKIIEDNYKNKNGNSSNINTDEEFLNS